MNEGDTKVDTKKVLIDALKSFGTVMVATTLDDGTVHARPMAVADIDDNGVMWFATEKESPKAQEVKNDARGLVTGQKGQVFASVSGTYAIVVDRARIEALWKPDWKVWFPEGKEDPNIALMRFAPEIGEYWDNGGTKGVRYLFEAARALVAGERARPNSKENHAKVTL